MPLETVGKNTIIFVNWRAVEELSHYMWMDVLPHKDFFISLASLCPYYLYYSKTAENINQQIVLPDALRFENHSFLNTRADLDKCLKWRLGFSGKKEKKKKRIWDVACPYFFLWEADTHDFCNIFISCPCKS